VTSDSDAKSFANTGVNLGGTTYATATGSGTSIDSVVHAQTALTNVKNAINQLATDRANIGSNIESLGYYNDQLGSLSNNLSAAKSRITDVDVAQESTVYAKNNILVQSGTAMLAQANSLPQSVLRLLG
jgi:flagellin